MYPSRSIQPSCRSRCYRYAVAIVLGLICAWIASPSQAGFSLQPSVATSYETNSCSDPTPVLLLPHICEQIAGITCLENWSTASATVSEFDAEANDKLTRCLADEFFQPSLSNLIVLVFQAAMLEGVPGNGRSLSVSGHVAVATPSGGRSSSRLWLQITEPVSIGHARLTAIAALSLYLQPQVSQDVRYSIHGRGSEMDDAAAARAANVLVVTIDHNHRSAPHRPGCGVFAFFESPRQSLSTLDVLATATASGRSFTSYAWLRTRMACCLSWLIPQTLSE